MARTIGRIEDLVVEDGKVEREAETDGMRRSELGLGNIRGILNEPSINGGT